MSGPFDAVVSAADAGVVVRVKVVPGASRDRLTGLLGDRLKVHVTAPPEAGKANKAVCALLAKVLGVPRRDVSVVAGHTHPEKQVAVAGVSAEQVAVRVGEQLL